MRLVALLKKEIKDGTLPVGAPSPSIPTLARQSGHGRGTCAKALRVLEREGLMIRYPGLGYYVTAQPAPESGTECEAEISYRSLED